MARRRRKGREAKLSPSELDQLYGARHFFGTSIEKKLDFFKPIDVYLQDPGVARRRPELTFDDDCWVEIEPNLGDGPTSARFAVVDYNSDSDSLAAPAVWDEAARHYVDQEGRVIDRELDGTFAFDQLNVWGLVQRALRFFEEPQGLGRPLSWAFEGNRLIVVPHAGYGENAFYDRDSKSLQFYYFDRFDRRAGENVRIYTCRSPDIVHHEAGHALLDAVRPGFYDSGSIEAGAFHESIGDLTAILLSFRNNTYRNKLASDTEGDLSAATDLASIAEQFGAAVIGQPYLRSALQEVTMDDVSGSQNGHEVSEVLTSAVFEIILDLSKVYIEQRGKTAAEAFWYTIQRMQRRIIQPLDFLPPVDITFRDYALAMLRVEALANPRDPYGYRDVMIRVFSSRGILSDDDTAELSKEDYVLDRGDWDYFHDVRRIASSKAAAYRFLDDNRRKLGIPQDRDVVVADLYTAEKYGRQNRRLPRQTVLEYLWQEELPMDDGSYGPLEGKKASYPCGGTLVFDDSGLLWHTVKHGPDDDDDRANRHLADIRQRLHAGQLGRLPDGARGILGTQVPPFIAEENGDMVRVRLAPHLSLSEHDHEGGYPWEISY